MDTIDVFPVWNEGSYTEKPCRGFAEDHWEFLHEHPPVPSQTPEINRRPSLMHIAFMLGHIAQRYLGLVSRGIYPPALLYTHIVQKLCFLNTALR